MKTKIFIFILLFTNIYFLYAQREAGIWYFGDHAGLDFNSGSPVALTNGALQTQEGCATFSDRDGNLLFYTDGSTVYNAQHRVMPNGSGLLGQSSSTQSAIVIPKPGSSSIYYIFTVDAPNKQNADDDFTNNIGDGKNDGLNYTEVDMRLNGGLGDVNTAKKNIHLITYNPNNSEEASFKCSEKITAVQNDDEISYWVITHFVNNFYAFKITRTGVQTNPVISKSSITVPLQGYIANAQGYLKSSPNGKKLAIAHGATKTSDIVKPGENLIIRRNTGKVLLYDFNNSTGLVTNETSILSGENPYGVEFSSKSKKLYVNSNNFDVENHILGSTLYHFDLESSNIAASKTMIKKFDFNAGALQLAIDEKIYIAGYVPLEKGRSRLTVINNPEAEAQSCTFGEISLNSRNSLLGLPPFIQSLFLFNFKYEFTCFGDSTHFFISTLEPVDSVIWDFGDGTTSTNLDAYHIYGSPGNYTVSLTKTVNGDIKEPSIKEVVISEKPLIFNGTFPLIQCDSYDSNPNDGLATFNLESSLDALTLNKADDYNVFFYLNDADALNDPYYENSINPIYRNTVPNQILTAKVNYKDGDCYSLGKVKLIANSSLLLLANDFIGCDLGDGTATFDFSTKENEIKSSLSLPNTVTIHFYDLEENAANNISPLGNDYISSEKVIYFSAENNGICYGAGSFDLIINYFPPVELNETVSICEGDFPIEINAAIPLNIQQNYSYKWSNGESTYKIILAGEQQISVTITDKIILCERQKTYDVVKVTAPNIIDVAINLNDNTARVITENNFDNLYAIDDSFGNFQPESTLYNLTPGTHTVYVKDRYDCDVASKTIFVFGFPKFFTPNNDGINDLWEIKGLNFGEFDYSEISIFNRFGKHLATISADSGWNGVYNGEFLPSNDYWFSINVTDQQNLTKTYKAHFSLIRK